MSAEVELETFTDHLHPPQHLMLFKDVLARTPQAQPHLQSQVPTSQLAI